jgi:hypothetical protein
MDRFLETKSFEASASNGVLMKWQVHRYGAVERCYAESDDREYNIDINTTDFSFSWEDETGSYKSVNIPLEIVSELLCRNGIMESMISYYVVYQVMSS